MTGTVGESFNILFLEAQPADVELLPGKPLLVSTGEVGTATEGRIITVSGVVSDLFDHGPFGFQFSVDDGSGKVAVFNHRSTGIDPFEIPFIGLGKKVRVTGYSGRFADEFEIQPRFPDDLRPAS